MSAVVPVYGGVACTGVKSAIVVNCRDIAYKAATV